MRQKLFWFSEPCSALVGSPSAQAFRSTVAKILRRKRLEERLAAEGEERLTALTSGSQTLRDLPARLDG